MSVFMVYNIFSKRYSRFPPALRVKAQDTALPHSKSLSRVCAGRTSAALRVHHERYRVALEQDAAQRFARLPEATVWTPVERTDLIRAA